MNRYITAYAIQGLYSGVVLYRNNVEIWKFDKFQAQLETLEIKEFVVGALLAGNFALSKINPAPVIVNKQAAYLDSREEYRKKEKEYSFKVEIPTTVALKNPITFFDSWDIIDINKMEVFQGEEGTQNIVSTCENAKELYNIWLRDGYGVSLYKFKTMNFLRGIFTMLKAFNIDYREMIIACPLKKYLYRGKYVVEYYAIDQYPLPLLPIKNKIINEKNILPETYAMCDHILNSNQNKALNEQERLKLIKKFIKKNYQFIIMGEPLDVIANKVIDLWKQQPQIGDAPSFMERLVIIKSYLDNKYQDSQLVDKMMNELTELLSYVPATNDLDETQQYIIFRRINKIGDTKANKRIKEYLERKHYI